MEAYCERQGKQIDSVRFLFDGERILATQTPEEVELLYSYHSYLFFFF